MKYVKLYSKKYTFQIVVVDASGRKGCVRHLLTHGRTRQRVTWFRFVAWPYALFSAVHGRFTLPRSVSYPSAAGGAAVLPWLPIVPETVN